MIITRTPYRLSLFGGGTDYPEWYLDHGGEVLAGAIDKWCYLTLRWLPPFFDHRYRIVYAMMENVGATEDIRHPVVRAILQKYDHEGGIELHHDGDLPARSGIGSSAAFAVGLIHAMRLLLELPVNSWDLAAEAIDLERNVLRETTGLQDQLTCALGGFHHFRFGTTGDIAAEQGRRLQLAVPDLSNWLVLMYSGVQRSSHEVSQGLVRSLEGHPKLLHELMEITREARELLERGGEESFFRLGKLLHETWRIKGELNASAISPRLAEIYNRALRVGAIGGKVSGAGGGGFMLFAVHPEQRSQFINAMRGAGLYVPFRFISTGSQVLFNDQPAT